MVKAFLFIQSAVSGLLLELVGCLAHESFESGRAFARLPTLAVHEIVPVRRALTNVAADKHFLDAASPQWL
jgi:hypothetical protein